MRIKFRYLIVIIFSMIICSCNEKNNLKADFDVVPLPQDVKSIAGEPFELNAKTKIVYQSGNEGLERTAHFLSEYIKESIGLELTVTDTDGGNNIISLQVGLSDGNSEAYNLTVDKSKIVINGASEPGVFYGAQTLRKSIPAGNNINSVSIPSVEIKDYPRFAYRGMHLDVSRHMFSVDDIKQYIDILALHNINRFHWHLTDDQGWRIEIKKYPELTTIGSMRAQTVIGKNTGKYDGKPYGGFYTQDEIKDIVKYAQDRFITIIPEVDLPGHMLAALSAYPNLGCTGGPYKVAELWGIFEDVLCAGNEDIYTFLEGVFDEVMELFPSEYIHVGGDECPKTQWEKCPKCQAKIRELGLRADGNHSAEQKLQSYVIQRMEKYINSKGRNIIGWDEILEGGAAPNATIMSWQGTEGGMAAAKLHHQAIMTPSTYLYFDYYQTKDTKDEPFGIGGYVPVEKVYNYEPMPEELSDEEKKFIIGVQANLWVEYIKDFDHVQYMVLPRIGALAEIQWTMPEKKDYDKFLPRLSKLTNLYEHLGYNYATHIFNISGSVETDNDNQQLKLSLSTFDNAPIYYTTDGTEPNEQSKQYSDVILIKEDMNIKAVAIRGATHKSKVYERSFDINKATFKPITLANQPWDKYAYAGASTLVDGQDGGDVFASGGWIGFQNDLVATIDLGSATQISSVSIGYFVDVASWIFNPMEYLVEVSSDNNIFTQVYMIEKEPVEEGHAVGAVYITGEFTPVEARYVRVTAKHLKVQPSWAGGAGKPAALFIDEIKID